MDKYTHIDEESIKVMVNKFYGKVRKDQALAPVFEQAIGVADDDWQPHLQTMYDFWSSVMLTSGRYHGNPMMKHAALPSFSEKLFDRWLELFVETAYELHHEHVAKDYEDRATRIAQSLKLGLFYKPKAMS